MKYCLFALVCLLTACTANDDVFDKSPSQRNKESIADLKRNSSRHLTDGVSFTSRRPTPCFFPTRRN